MYKRTTEWEGQLFKKLAGIILGLALSAAAAATDFDALNQKLRASYPDIEIVSVEEVYRQLQSPTDDELLLLDARTKKEYEVSHISGAQLTPGLKEALDLLADAPRDRKIIVYCSLGYRSGNLVRQLQQRGYTQVVNMEGSLFEWVEKDLPVVQAGEEVQQAHPYNLWWGRNLRQDYRSYSP